MPLSRPSQLPAITRALAAAALSVIAALSPISTTHAVPLGIRAKTHVEIEHRKGPSGVVLVGRLLDDTSMPVPDERITLELPGLPAVTRVTDGAGRFERPLSARELSRLRKDGDAVTWTARFDGSARLGATSETGTIDLSKRSTRLEVRVAGAPPGAASHVVLGDRPIDVSVALNDVSAVTPRPLTQAEIALEVGSGAQLVGATGLSGGATFVVRPSSLAGAGRYRVSARFGGDALHAPSEGEAELVVLLPTRTTLRVVREGDERHGRYRVSGRVSDQDGPLAEQIVSIVGAHEGAAAFELVAATDRDGIFVAALSAAELQAIRDRIASRRAQVRLEIRAAHLPADDRHAPSESASVLLDVPLPPGVPLRWYLVALGGLAIIIALAQALRTGALMRRLAAMRLAFSRWLERLRRGRPAVVPDAPELPFVIRREAADGPAVRTHDRLSGIVVDAHTRQPLVGRVTASSQSERHVAVTTAAGAFSLGPLAPGPWSVMVEAPGHLPREIALQLPHGGDYDGAYWTLIAVHRSVREIFAKTLAGLETPLAWGYATPREATRDALATLPAAEARTVVEPPLDELTHIVERTHFAQRSGTPADVERALALRETVATRPARSALPGGGGDAS